MNILVTGANGQLGTALARRLKCFGSIMATDRVTLDLTKLNSISGILDHLAPDIIFNAAAYTAVDQAEEEPDEAYLVNGRAPGLIARWAARRSVPIVHFSTDYVFDGSAARPWREDDAARPVSVYGLSKLCGEDEVRAAEGCSLIVRTSWVYAANGKNFLCTISQLAASRTELRVVADQIGAPTSAALIADSVAIMLEQGLQSFRRRVVEANGIVHLTASGETSWHLFAKEIVDGLEARDVSLAVKRVLPIRTCDHAAPAKRPSNSRLDLTRLHDVFGITTSHWKKVLEPELDALALQWSKS